MSTSAIRDFVAVGNLGPASAAPKAIANIGGALYSNDGTTWSPALVPAQGLQPNSLDGGQVANVAEGQANAGILVGHVIDIPDGVTGNIDTGITFKERVLSVEIHKGPLAGGAGDTIQVSNGATPITDAMSINVAAKTVVKPATFDEAQAVILASGNIRVVRTKASAANVACKVIVTTVRSA